MATMDDDDLGFKDKPEGQESSANDGDGEAGDN